MNSAKLYFFDKYITYKVTKNRKKFDKLLKKINKKVNKKYIYHDIEFTNRYIYQEDEQKYSCLIYYYILYLYEQDKYKSDIWILLDDYFYNRYTNIYEININGEIFKRM